MKNPTEQLLKANLFISSAKFIGFFLLIQQNALLPRKTSLGERTENRQKKQKMKY